MQVHGADLFPLISMMPFDALNVGNHDLYDNSTVEFMETSGFIDGWNGSYLTSNVMNATTGETLGERYTVITGEASGAKVLVMGFLYYQTDACQGVTVKAPSVTVAQDWFLAALKDGVAQGVKAVVILAVGARASYGHLRGQNPLLTLPSVHVPSTWISWTTTSTLSSARSAASRARCQQC